MKKGKKLRRSDRCYLVGARGLRLSRQSVARSAIAWEYLCERVEQLGDKDVPKFEDLLEAIRSATIEAHKQG